MSGERFVRKRELHVTVVGSRDKTDPAVLLEAARGLEFSVRPTGRRRLVRKGAQASIIELVSVTGLDEFHARLKGAAARMPSHVTLFTAGDTAGRGIGLYSDAELETHSSPFELALEPDPWRLDGDGAILGA